MRALLAEPGDCPQVIVIERLDLKSVIAAHCSDESDTHNVFSQPVLPASPVELRDEYPKLPPIYESVRGEYSTKFEDASEDVSVEANGTSRLIADESDPTACPAVITNDRQLEEPVVACEITEDADTHDVCSQSENPMRKVLENEFARTRRTEMRRSCVCADIPLVIDNNAT